MPCRSALRLVEWVVLIALPLGVELDRGLRHCHHPHDRGSATNTILYRSIGPGRAELAVGLSRRAAWFALGEGLSATDASRSSSRASR
jgi:hypothetical protein